MPLRGRGRPGLWKELTRRRVFHVAVMYAVVGWLVIQVVATTFPLLGVPDTVAQMSVLLVLLGFPVALVLAWIYDLTPAGLTRTADADAAHDGDRSLGGLSDAAGVPGYGPARVAVTALFVMLVVVAGWATLRDRDPGAGAMAAGLDGAVRSIAVLPLQNLSREPAQDLFVDGLTEELITSIARIGGLAVKSRSTVMRYRTTSETASVVARELGVDAVLEGSALLADGRVRVTVRLIEATRDEAIWAESYETSLRDMLALQSEIARAIAASMHVRLTERDRERLGVARGPVDAEAYEAYLRGISLFSRYNINDNRTAIELLQRAADRDAGFAEAHGFLAFALALYAFSYEPENREPLERRARAALDRALAVDPSSAYARLARARLLWTREHGWPHDQVLHQLREALALQPASDHVIRQLAIVYSHIGYPELALDELRKLDVMQNVARAQIALARSIQGRPADVLEEMQAIPPHARSGMTTSLLAEALYQLGRPDDAWRALDDHDRGRGEPYPQVPALRGLLLAVAGRHAEAEVEIGKALAFRSSGEFHHASLVIAAAYVRLERHDEALQWLEWTTRDGFPCYPLIARSSYFAALHDDPRFTSLLDALRTEWEHYGVMVRDA
jgi:TolB-like protein